jgi:hypothetical protein
MQASRARYRVVALAIGLAVLSYIQRVAISQAAGPISKDLIQAVVPAMLCMATASFCSDSTMPISWNACVEIGGSYTATVAATMNMLGNLAGFVAPVVGGSDSPADGWALEPSDLPHGGLVDAFRMVLALSGSKPSARES